MNPINITIGTNFMSETHFPSIYVFVKTDICTLAGQSTISGASSDHFYSGRRGLIFTTNSYSLIPLRIWGVSH